MDEGMDRVRRQRRLGEARQDQLELSRVRGDVPDREDSGERGGAARRIDPDTILVERQAPGGNRSEIGGQAKERQ